VLSEAGETYQALSWLDRLLIISIGFS